MRVVYRQLREEDAVAYQALMYAAYASIRELGIHFDAATADVPRVTRHLHQHTVYGMYLDDVLVSSVTLRHPWSPLPGPYGLPHIGWFGTHPDYQGKGLAKQMLHWLEQEVLLGELRAPAVSLGTAQSHPWLAKMYQSLGFEPMGTTDLGKGHITLYMKKVLDPQRHQAWMTQQGNK